jgi:two-component system LytT family response regulator
MIRVLVVDDEPLARGKIRGFLEAHTDFEIAAECGDGREALNQLTALQPDALFLDVQMPHLDGMQMLGKARLAKPPYTVMTTAFEDYAVRAFEASALDYLLKPFDQRRFDSALQRIRSHVERDVRAAGRLDLDLMLKKLGHQAAEPVPRLAGSERVPVKIGRRVRFLSTTHMRCIRADRDYVNIHMTTGEVIHTSDRISQMEEKLSSFPFLRIHRSTIVNLEQVREVRAAGACYDFMLNGDMNVVSGCTYKREIHALLATWKKTGDRRIT